MNLPFIFKFGRPNRQSTQPTIINYCFKMLTELQKQKQTHFFHILDFDCNGLVQKGDFEAIGENLAVIRGFEPGSEEYSIVMNSSLSVWEKLTHYVHGTDCTLDMWLTFIDSLVINSDQEWYNQYVNGMVQTLFDLFDTDQDGYISLDEYLDLFIGLRIEVRFAPKSFKSLDLNQDGRISRTELMRSVEEFLKSDDSNATGNWLFGYWEV